MISLAASLALSTAMTVAASTNVARVPHDGTLARAAAAAFSRIQADAPVPRAASSNDSLRNGAIIGAIAGGLTVATLASFGCGVGEALSEQFGAPESSHGSCSGPLIVGAAIGAGLGALIGVGMDAMLEQAPGMGAGHGGRRKGVRLRVQF